VTSVGPLTRSDVGEERPDILAMPLSWPIPWISDASDHLFSAFLTVSSIKPARRTPVRDRGVVDVGLSMSKARSGTAGEVGADLPSRGGA
jgi:hypothetical protein